MGEVRVRKNLLEGEIPGRHTVSFRIGHLRFPPTLVESLRTSRQMGSL